MLRANAREFKGYLKSLGERVQELRKKKGWSQEEFAAQCGLHRTYMGAIERGERNVAVINLRKISDALGMKVGELFV